MTVRDQLERSLAIGGAVAALGVGAFVTTEQAAAVAPPATGGSTDGGLTLASAPGESNKPIPDFPAAAVASTITVPETAQPVLRDVDVRTFIKHEASGDLDIELISPIRPGQPARTVKLIVGGPDGAGASNDVFDNTLWDDSATTLASDLVDPVTPSQAALVPEGALGKFVGIDPRGVWTLRILDRAAVDIGTLTSWQLQLATQNPAPVVTPPAPYVSAAPTPIPDAPAAGAASTINVSGAKGYLWDVDLLTNILHDAPVDLEIRLSHAGRTAVISTRVTSGSNTFYNNRTFDDSAAALISQSPGPGDSVPEGALAAFIGTDPNGLWTLQVKDADASATGTLNGWQLKLASTDAAVPAGPVPPAVTPPVAPIVKPPALKVKVRSLSLKETKNGRLKITFGWLRGNGRIAWNVRLSTKVGKKTVVRRIKGVGQAGPKTFVRTVKVPANWQGRKTTALLTLKNGAVKVTRTKTIRL